MSTNVLMRIRKGKSLNVKTRGINCVNCRNEEEEEMKKSRVAFAEASSASLDYVDSSDASRYKGTREICEAIMDPIAVTALLYKLNIVKLQLYIVCRLLIVSRKGLSSQ